MTYLPSLIKKIDDFVSLVESMNRLKKMAAPPQTWSMPDDPEEEEETLQGDEFTGLYPKVMDIINEINASESNEDIANELQLIAELYKKAIEINGGYKQLQDYIKRAMANIDMLIDESDGVIGDDVRDLADEVLEDLSSDLRQRAKSTVAPQAPDAQAMQQLKAVKDAFNSAEARAEVEAQKSVYERGKPGQETGHTIVRKTAETPDKYAKEIARLKDSLQTTTDQNTRNNVEYLIATLVSLLDTMKTVKNLEGELKVSPDDAATVQAFDKATADLERLRKQRLVYRRKLNELILKEDQTDLRRKMYETRDPREKAWLEDRIRLLDLRMNEKLLRKRDMIKALKAKINSSGTLDERGDFQALTLPEATRQSLEEAYQSGALKSITKDQYDREQTVERAKQHGKVGPVPTRQKGRIGGGRAGEKIHQYDVSSATFSGLVDKLSERINTSAHVARLNVTQMVVDKKKVHNELKPFVDAVSKAIQKKDNVAKLAAIKNLKAQMKARMDKVPAIKALARNIKWLPFFQRMKADLETVAGWQTDQGWDLNENKTMFIQNLLTNGRKITDAYRRYYPETGPKRTNQLEISFDSTVGYMDAVLDQLAERTGVNV
jgi:hypothetical protein